MRRVQNLPSHHIDLTVLLANVPCIFLSTFRNFSVIVRVSVGRFDISIGCVGSPPSLSNTTAQPCLIRFHWTKLKSSVDEKHEEKVWPIERSRMFDWVTENNSRSSIWKRSVRVVRCYSPPHDDTNLSSRWYIHLSNASASFLIVVWKRVSHEDDAIIERDRWPFQLFVVQSVLQDGQLIRLAD